MLTRAVIAHDLLVMVSICFGVAAMFGAAVKVGFRRGKRITEL